METVRLTIQNSLTGATEEVVATFSADDWSTLRDFVVFSADLRRASLLNRKRTTGFRFAVSGDESLCDATDPELSEMAMLLRPFLLNDERTNFLRVANTVGGAIAHPYLREQFNSLRQVFAGATSQRLFSLRLDGVVVNSEEMLRTWLNGFLFHRDPEKRAAMKAFQEGTTMRIAWGVMVDMLVDKAVAVLNLAELIKALQSPDGTSDGQTSTT